MNRFKAALKSRKTTFGSWLTFANEATTEIMARAGFDWLVIDMEHAPFGVCDAARIIRIIDLAGSVPICRLPSNDPALIKNVLDAGAKGIMIPLIESAQAARQAVEAAYYPPVGRRGVGLARAQGYGNAFEDYRKAHKDELVVVAMIETRQGVENVEEIAAVPGIDGLLIGPYDLSGSVGLIGQVDHPELNTYKRRVIDAARRAGIGCGIHLVHPNPGDVENSVKEGYTFLALGVDMILLDGAAREAFGWTKRAHEGS